MENSENRCLAKVRRIKSLFFTFRCMFNAILTWKYIMPFSHLQSNPQDFIGNSSRAQREKIFSQLGNNEQKVLLRVLVALTGKPSDHLLTTCRVQDFSSKCWLFAVISLCKFSSGQFLYSQVGQTKKEGRNVANNRKTLWWLTCPHFQVSTILWTDQEGANPQQIFILFFVETFRVVSPSNHS